MSNNSTKTELATITSEALSTTFAPKAAMRQYSRCTTIGRALNSNAPRLRDLVGQLGTKKTEAYLKLWLLDLNEVLDLKRPLNPRQVDDLAFRIVNKYRSLNIADINLIFEQVKNGDQGAISYQLTVPTVMKWFTQYFDERCTVAANDSYQDHVQKKSAFAGIGDAERGKKEMRDAAKWYNDKQARAQAQERVNKAKAPQQTAKKSS